MHLLSRYSVRVEVWDGEARGLLRCGDFSREQLREEEGLMKDYRYMAAMGREKGSGESQETKSGRDGN